MAGGCGVGKGLDVFSKLYKKDPELIKDAGEVLTLKKAIEELRAALQKAKKRTGKLDKDTTSACETYLELIDGYEKKLGLGVTEDQDDDEVWNKILVAMPKAIGEMVKSTKAMEDAIKKLARYNETAELLRTRAIARNKLPLSGASRKDLEKALEMLQKAVGEIDNFTNKEAGFASRVAFGVLDLEEKLRSRKHDKDMRAFREMIVKIGKTEGSLRDALTDTVNLTRAASDAIAQTQKTVDRIRDLVESRKTMFWDNPAGGVEALNLTLADVRLRAQEIIDVDLTTLGEAEKRKLSDKMRRIDEERIQLDSGVTNMGNIVRTTAGDTKEFATDKEIAQFLKEMLSEYKKITTENTAVEKLVLAAGKKIADMGA